jgi:hypothetical protein
MNYLKIVIALLLCTGISHNQTVHAATRPSKLVYYATHAAGAFCYAQAEKLAVSFLTGLIAPTSNPFSNVSGEGSSNSFAEGRLGLVFTLVRLYGSFKLPGLINTYIFGSARERSIPQNLQSLLLRSVIPYPEIGALVSEYLVQGYDQL